MTDIELTQDEYAVLMHMSGDFGYPASQISADLHYEHPDAGWTPRKVNKIQRSLHAKGVADFGVLICEETGELRGKGYWLCGHGLEIRYNDAQPNIVALAEGDVGGASHQTQACQP